MNSSRNGRCDVAFKFKNDQYRAARGNRTRMVDISCRVCGQHIMVYQKDDYPGRLRRLYFDRIFSPPRLVGLERTPLSKAKPLNCSGCKEMLGTPYVYRKENRKAFKIYQDALVKRARRLDG